jgi:hypothetical protein
VPAGAATPTYSVNGTNAAQNTTVTFYLAGSYTFQVTVKDPAGLTATSSVSLTVSQTLTSVAVTPSSASLTDGTSQQFSATAKDQFGTALVTQPTFTWTLGSGSAGTLSTTGLYTAPSSGSGSATVQASTGGVTGTASVTYGSVPAAPSNLVATSVTSSKVTLSWTDNSSNETGFVVQRSSNGGKTWTTLTTTAANVTSYSDTTVGKRKTYEYRVYATNSYGNSAYSNTVTVTTPSANVAVGTAAGTGVAGGKAAAPSGAAPAAPADVVATSVSPAQVTLSWSAGAGNATGFVVQRSADGGKTWTTLATVGAQATSFTDTSVSSDRTYLYAVDATDRNGTWSFGDLLDVTTPS